MITLSAQPFNPLFTWAECGRAGQAKPKVPGFVPDFFFWLGQELQSQHFARNLKSATPDLFYYK